MSSLVAPRSKSCFLRRNSKQRNRSRRFSALLRATKSALRARRWTRCSRMCERERTEEVNRGQPRVLAQPGSRGSCHGGRGNGPSSHQEDAVVRMPITNRWRLLQDRPSAKGAVNLRDCKRSARKALVVDGGEPRRRGVTDSAGGDPSAFSSFFSVTRRANNARRSKL